jgi:hypothetical protein
MRRDLDRKNLLRKSWPKGKQLGLRSYRRKRIVSLSRLKVWTKK